MGLRLSPTNDELCYFVTTSFYKNQRFGDIQGVYRIIAESINNRLQKTKALLIGYVFMPSHIHLLLLISGDKLSGFMRDFKKYTAQKGLKDIIRERTIWQSRFDRVGIWNENVLRTKLEYIHNNPVKAGLVTRPEDWQWSSARDYYIEEQGPLPVWKGWI